MSLTLSVTLLNFFREIVEQNVHRLISRKKPQIVNVPIFSWQHWIAPSIHEFTEPFLLKLFSKLPCCPWYCHVNFSCDYYIVQICPNVCVGQKLEKFPPRLENSPKTPNFPSIHVIEVFDDSFRRIWFGLRLNMSKRVKHYTKSLHTVTKWNFYVKSIL